MFSTIVNNLFLDRQSQLAQQISWDLKSHFDYHENFYNQQFLLNRIKITQQQGQLNDLQLDWALELRKIQKLRQQNTIDEEFSNTATHSRVHGLQEQIRGKKDLIKQLKRLDKKQANDWVEYAESANEKLKLSNEQCLIKHQSSVVTAIKSGAEYLANLLGDMALY
jgi:paraquat-inducible protein B